MTDRAEKIFRCVDIENKTGLEIGPLANPLITRAPGRQIYYADYAPREVLREKSRSDPNVNIDNIPEIDFIIQPMPDSLGMTFDYIAASHVGEHVPDFVGWIHTLLGWLNPGGRIILALPDCRYIFDCYRPMSTAGQMIEAYLERRTAPSLSSIYDGFSKAVQSDIGQLWDGIEPTQPYAHYFTNENALSLTKKAHETGQYQDCHCWVFSADHFQSLMGELAEIGIAKFKIARLEPTEKYKTEFYVDIIAS